MSATTACSAVSRHLSARLDHEWAQLGRRSAVLDRIRSWDVTATPFRSLDELLRLAGFKVARTVECDELLGRLVAHAGNDPLAARIVLQRLLPGLLAIARVEQQRDRSAEAFEQLVAEAWLAIVSYRIDLRPTDVAARLLNDARHRAFTTPRRRQERSREDAMLPARLDLPRVAQPGSSFEELTIVLREARQGGLPDDDLAVVRDYLAGRTRGDVTPRTLRNRRKRSLDKIRRLAA